MKHSSCLLLLTETWLTSDIKSSEMLLSQYIVVRADRKSKTEKSKHGGCLIAVSNNVSFTEEDIRHLSEAIQESLVVIKLNQTEPAVIAPFYYPPKEAHMDLNKTTLMLFFAFYQFSLIKNSLRW